MSTVNVEVNDANAETILKLVSALNNLGNVCSVSGDKKRALAAFQEAVDLCRHLALHGRGEPMRLAGVLSNMGSVLADIGRTDEALVVSQEAVALTRQAAGIVEMPNVEK
jgi:tetratricopeptide (TPR) repeat protein